MVGAGGVGQGRVMVGVALRRYGDGGAGGTLFLRACSEKADISQLFIRLQTPLATLGHREAVGASVGGTAEEFILARAVHSRSEEIQMRGEYMGNWTVVILPLVSSNWYSSHSTL